MQKLRGASQAELSSSVACKTLGMMKRKEKVFRQAEPFRCIALTHSPHFIPEPALTQDVSAQVEEVEGT